MFAAAKWHGSGVLQVAADEGILSIGRRQQPNYLHPGSVLTSMLKRVDVAVYDAFTTGPEVETGVHVFGLAEDGVGSRWTSFNKRPDHRRDDPPPCYAARGRSSRARFVVHNFSDDGTCPCRCSDPLEA